MPCTPRPRAIKSRMRWAEKVARMGRVVYSVLVGKPEGKNHLENLGIDGTIRLKWIFRKWDVVVWTGSSWLGIGTGGGEFLDKLRTG